MTTEISVSYGYAKNRGNFESERIDASITVKIPEGLCQQDIETIRQTEFDKCKGFVREQLGFHKEIEEDMRPANDEPVVHRRRSIGRRNNA